jgi:CPA2 family monovalent cation:H+ antiporter-2
VAIGMQIAPAFLWAYLPEALLITAVYFVAKILSCAGAAFLAGESAATSIRVGANMAQLGEFAFLLATLGFQLGLSGEYLYALIVAVASLNALVRPYVVDNADALAHGIGRCLPGPLKRFIVAVPRQIKATHATPRPHKAARRLVLNLGLQITVGIALISGGFIVGSHAAKQFSQVFGFIHEDWRQRLFPLLWLLMVVVMLPLFVGTVRKMQAMAMLLSEITVEEDRTRAQRALRRILQTFFFRCREAEQLMNLLGVVQDLLDLTKEECCLSFCICNNQYVFTLPKKYGSKCVYDRYNSTLGMSSRSTDSNKPFI